MHQRVTVFLVDDSAVSRAAMRRALEPNPDLTVVGEATDGEEALNKIPMAAPDIILMDIVMPGMDGLEATRELMHSFPRPILIISDQIGGSADPSFEALRAGALEVIGKPSAAELADPEFVSRLGNRIRMLAGIPVITRYRTGERHRPRRRPSTHRPQSGEVDLVTIGASTGGPPALQRLLGGLPRTPRWPTLIVQHMTPGFTAGMITWLARATERHVELAKNGVRPEPGVVYVAPDGQHLELRGRRLRLSDSTAVEGHQPSVDVLFASIASTGPASTTIGALLTGMGKDGANGLGLLREAGAWTIAQDEASSVVYGMPKAAAEQDAACEILTIDDLSLYLAALA